MEVVFQFFWTTNESEVKNEKMKWKRQNKTIKKNVVKIISIIKLISWKANIRRQKTLNDIIKFSATRNLNIIDSFVIKSKKYKFNW